MLRRNTVSWRQQYPGPFSRKPIRHMDFAMYPRYFHDSSSEEGLDLSEIWMSKMESEYKEYLDEPVFTHKWKATVEFDDRSINVTEKFSQAEKESIVDVLIQRKSPEFDADKNWRQFIVWLATGPTYGYFEGMEFIEIDHYGVPVYEISFGT
ncbi:hypothetical protein M427DRAFT_494861 [Gonapodya prolifera JEL478]|uniref:Uncharacterized protein n=1 Tax=Gonapodya prolifera (strain JEL478) TaxID=1344416 RepID=A0A139AIT4_GONPJ|nr:hypothetical protein M427DRAFT_494861 [Gonapodya prolifera JEL478]|eukprot:KXS16712.1 hypothetical protein M427DRAFT_494861 [Gonapodya prolifera JEL478]